MKGWFKRLFRAKKNQAEPAVYFTHIPKTAGTSFIVLLDRFFHADEIFPHQLWRENKSIDTQYNRRYKLFRGHFGGGGVNLLSNRPIEYLTILRNPTSLAHSTYQFVKREKNTKVHQLIHDKNMTFAEFLMHPATTPLVQNRMIRNISFDFKADPAAQEVFLSVETIDYLQNIINQQGVAISDEQRLNRSKTFIDQCRWFGLLERFEESLQLLCYSMNWPPMGTTQKLNTYKQKTDLTDDEVNVLAEVNKQDTALYQYACKVFDQKLRVMRQQLDQLRSSELQTIDELLDINYQRHQMRQGELQVGEFKYDFAQPLFGSQWHRRELMYPEKEYFRWTGPGHQAHIDFWVESVDYQIAIRIINGTSEGCIDSLKLSINGHVVEWQSPDKGVVRILELTCTKAMIQENGLLRLGIECSEMSSHQQAFNSDDERVVGVAVHWIQFSHAN